MEKQSDICQGPLPLFQPQGAFGVVRQRGQFGGHA